MNRTESVEELNIMVKLKVDNGILTIDSMPGEKTFKKVGCEQCNNYECISDLCGKYNKTLWGEKNVGVRNDVMSNAK